MILWKSSKIELKFDYTIAAHIDLFKVNNRNTRTIGEMCLKLTMKTPKDAFCKGIRKPAKDLRYSFFVEKVNG